MPIELAGTRWRVANRVLLEFTTWFLAGLLVCPFPSLSTSAQEAWDSDAASFRGSDQSSSVRGTLSDIFKDLDRFWLEFFEDAGIAYRAPSIVLVTKHIYTDCGSIWPTEENAYYCPRDSTIYLLPRWLEDQADDLGDYAPVTIIAHEWGHHIQFLLAVSNTDSKAFERQADCLSGVFTAFADENGLLDEGDFLEAIDFTLEIGDDALGLPLDNPGAHGTSEERIKSLMRGFGGGPVAGCGLPFEPEVKTPTPTQVPPVPQLPPSPPVDHASCFSTDSDETFDLDVLTERLGGTDEARQNLLNWEWQTGVRRAFGCYGPPPGKAGWIDIHLHLFSSPDAARQAVDYFVAKRIEGTALSLTGTTLVGDYGVGIRGPAVNGTEFTIYASQGPIVIRVTGVSPSGIPIDDVETVAQSVLAAQFGGAAPGPIPTPTPPTPTRPASDYLPNSPALNYAECFQTRDRGTYSHGDVADVFAQAGLSPTELGWADGAYIVFFCADPPNGRASQLDVVIHQFRDASAAQQAMPLATNMYIPGENETRACDAAANLVVCVTGRSITGSPLTDVYFVLNQVVNRAR